VPLYQLPEGGFVVAGQEALKQLRVRGGAELVRPQELSNLASSQGGRPLVHGLLASRPILVPLSTTYRDANRLERAPFSAVWLPHPASTRQSEYEIIMEHPTASVGRRAPDFALPCTWGPGSTRRVTLGDYGDRWLILVFYPRDFSLVCPTELTALSVRFKEFSDLGCDILGISTDSLESHERWIATPRAQGGLGEIHFPLASDSDGAAARAYGVYLERQHVALRGLFIIDPNGVLQYQTVHNLSVGRRSDEVLRILTALQSGGMCPEDWCVGCEPIDPTLALQPGTMLGHYRVEAEAGQGTFAAVFRAHDTVLDRQVALKVFRSGTPFSPLAILGEARAAAALNHPNVCTIFAVEDSEGVPVIVMEYVDGRPLSKLLQEGRLSPVQVAGLGRQIARGMAAAHGLGIVHGDLKPANLLVTHDDVVKITDFGLSRRALPPQTNEETQLWDPPQGGSIAGTPGYMSPEQTRGEPATPASDVFSLGAVLYEMLTGKLAFTGENVLRVLDQIRLVEPDRFAAEVPDPFPNILRGSLVREVRQRWMTMERIGEILK
jgi:alkyl hydroperoxide reductase subunit AhpC